jgi:branched-chain amino acid aminotransferase
MAVQPSISTGARKALRGRQIAATVEGPRSSCHDREMASLPTVPRQSDDPRNAELIVSVNGELVERAKAVVSVFDAGFVLGDGVWEGLRVWNGHPAFLKEHLDRLCGGAAAIGLDIGLTRAELTARIYETLAANEMSADGVHIRLMVTRGVKAVPYQDPRLGGGPATVIIVARHDRPSEELIARGLSLFTVHVRRAPPDTLDPKLNSHSKLSDVLALIQAQQAGADEALMLDPLGFVSTCNSTHFFVVRGGEVWTSTGEYCLAGITRRSVLRICADVGIPAHERRFSLTDVYGADEAFVTGTLAGIVPVHTIDGRTIGEGKRGLVVERLQLLYDKLARDDIARRLSRRT